jgi:hypothetical protein
MIDAELGVQTITERPGSSRILTMWFFPPSPPKDTPPEVVKAINRLRIKLLKRSRWFWVVCFGMTASAVVAALAAWRWAPSLNPFVTFYVPMFISIPILFRLNEKPRKAAWLAYNLCPACGYNLTATPDRCPECGREVVTGKTR